jgi:hypothetical protein
MTKINCKLISSSNSVFLQQIYTGFFLLNRAGLIDLKQVVKKNKNIKSNDPGSGTNVEVIVNGKIKLYYDTKDGTNVDVQALNESHFYFKRSYNSKKINQVGDLRERIFPLGLNYAVFPSSFDPYSFSRNCILSDGIKKITGCIKTFDIRNHFNFLPRINLMHALPDYNADPKIIFMVKAYDPNDVINRRKEKVEERIQLNETRAKCIKYLNSEFGNKFYGGFYHNTFTKKNYSDCLIPDGKKSEKRNYINILKSYPICIANSGLHGSIGWKFAEYIAFSKAIISEKMDNSVPGNLENGKNYLEFLTPEDCVNKAIELFHDKDLRNSIMQNNTKYYFSYLRPDALIMNTLLIASNG